MVKICRLVITRLLLIPALVLLSCQSGCRDIEKPIPTGSVIFIHPDGSGAAMWTACRLLEKGPDGMLNWDRMEQMGLYRGHQLNSTNSTSHAGGTTHAYGVKVSYETYGAYAGAPVTARSGKTMSIMQEAREAGKSVALVNSGHLCEPGTGAFVAGARHRQNTDTLSLQIIESGVDLIFSGGETLLLPAGVIGRHGKAGVRRDGRDLIARATELGYTVIYTREELLDLPQNTPRVLGVFAAVHTFNDRPEEVLREQGLPFFQEAAPTLAEMTEVALRILSSRNQDFLLVVEEEGTDNFAGVNNAAGTLTALARADQAIGIALAYMEKHPRTLLLTAADSYASGLQVMNVRDPLKFEENLPAVMRNGAPLDGRNGTGSPPFVAQPDRFGNQLRFGICWAADVDTEGGVVAKAHGLNAGLLPRNVDNTDIYRMMYATLFGTWLQ